MVPLVLAVASFNSAPLQDGIRGNKEGALSKVAYLARRPGK